MSDKLTRTMQSRLLYLFTRTPLHVGAGASVGAIDQPIQRERHTGFPIIPGTALKGVLADDYLARNEDGSLAKDESGKPYRAPAGRLIFGDERTAQENAPSGSVSFGEAKLLAFPVRSGRGCFAWLISPLVVKRWSRDAGLNGIPSIPNPVGNQAWLDESTLGQKAIFEDYTFICQGSFPNDDAKGKWLGALQNTISSDPVWRDCCAKHLALVSDEALAHFAHTASDVAQHVKIDDISGTAADRALFNQENVPSETLFYAPLVELRPNILGQLKVPPIVQIGGDATTGLGYCTTELTKEIKQ
jgi:CRISPR-associated protein Cmr4